MARIVIIMYTCRGLPVHQVQSERFGYIYTFNKEDKNRRKSDFLTLKARQFAAHIKSLLYLENNYPLKSMRV